MTTTISRLASTRRVKWPLWLQNQVFNSIFRLLSGVGRFQVSHTASVVSRSELLHKFRKNFNPDHIMSANTSTDLDELLAGVPELESNGAIGPVIVFGPQAFAVAVGKYSGVNVPFIGASRLGDGRVYMAGHDGYIAPLADCPNARRLIVNAVRWATGGRAGLAADGRPHIALYRVNSALKETLTAAGGFELDTINDTEVARIDPKTYNGICVGNTNYLSEGPRLEAVRAFVKAGGGLLAGNTAWSGWDKDTVKESHPGNQLLWAAGLGWTAVYPVKPADGAKTFSTDRGAYADTNAQDAWTALHEAYATGVELAEERALQVRTILTMAAEGISPDDELLLRRVRTELGRVELPVPGEKCPVTDTKIKPLLFCSDKLCQINPAYANFPGDCAAAPEKDAVTVSMHVGAKGTWHSTGLYAPAGQQVTAEIEDSDEKGEHKFALQIGTHRDNLYNNAEWHRFPVVIVKCAKKKGPKCTLTLTSTFGGLIYICTESDGPPRGITVKITGGALAPYFVLGTTTLEEWKIARERKTPWGEISGVKMTLTVPSDKLAKLDDPETLMMQWDDVMDNFADICAISRDRPRDYRMCADVQLSGGWMHSGYPFMIYLEAVDLALDVVKLSTKDAWGYYHEIGHNHQKPVWTWKGLTEVTNNILCMHVLNTMFGMSWEEARPDSFAPEPLRKNVGRFIEGGRRISDLEADPFLYLTKYMQLQKKYGWKAYTKVFKFYEELPKEKEPKKDADRIDLWIQTFSTTVGENLVPFYKSWGFTPGASVEGHLKDLGLSIVADLSVDKIVE